MHNVKEYVKFTNANGDSITFDSTSIEGLGDVGADIQQQRSPFVDGTSYIDTVLEPRYVNVEFIVRGDNYEDVVKKRTELARIVNPKLGLGVLSYIVDDGTEVEVRLIEAVAESVPFYADKENRGKRWQRGLITFVAPNPYWKSPSVTEEPMASFVPMFELPSDEHWEVGEDGNLYFEVGIEGEIRTFNIKGDAETPVRITFNGPSVNPVVQNNTTGEYIKINRTLGPDDVLFIDTSNATVEINGENAFNWIDPGSTFWNLQLGDNEIQYTADSGKEEASLIIEWQEQFIAV